MFRFILVSFSLLTGIFYIVQKNSGYETGFSASGHFASAQHNNDGYGNVDPQYTEENYAQTSKTKKLPLEVASTLLLNSALLPVKKPPLLLALPMLRPDPNAPMQTASATVNERITLSSAHGNVPEKYQPEIFNVPALKPEHMSPGKLLKKRRRELAGNTAAVYRDKVAESSEQYSRHSQVKLKKLFTSRLKRHPHGYRRRHLSAYSYYVRKRDPVYYARKKSAKKGRRHKEAKASSSSRSRRRRR